jgi:glycosyltransferase involved in cell wall biosynthesis
MNTPLVSILMTAYNRENYISSAIESVLASTYNNFELIIVDDCSADSTVEIANSYAAKDSRITIISNDQNLGDYPNRNKAASYARGKYLKYLDSDDMIMPWSIEIMVYCMEHFPNAALGISSNKTENMIYPKLISPVQAYRSYYYANRILSVGPTGTIIRRDVFSQIGGFSGENYIGDIELWLLISQKYSVLYLPPGLIYWREHEGQQIVEERKNSFIELKRYNLDCSILSNHENPLTAEEAKIILQNLRNIKTRNILKSIFSGEFRSAINKVQLFKIGFIDFLNSLKKNKIVQKI